MDMKKMLAKMSEVQGTTKPSKNLKETNTTPKAGKKVIKESPNSLKSWFNKLSEDAPIPVPVQQQGSNKPALAGVVTINDPELQKTLGPTINKLAQDKKITVVTPQEKQQQQGQTSNQSQPASGVQATPNAQPVSEDELDEDKWIKKAIKHPGEFSAKAKKAGMSTAAFAAKHEHDSGKLGRQARLAQTLSKLREEGIEEADIPHTGGVDVNGAGLGAGRSQTTLEAETLQQAGVDGTRRGGLGMGRSKKHLDELAPQTYMNAAAKRQQQSDQFKNDAEWYKLKGVDQPVNMAAQMQQTLQNKAAKLNKVGTRKKEYQDNINSKVDQLIKSGVSVAIARSMNLDPRVMQTFMQAKKQQPAQPAVQESKSRSKADNKAEKAGKKVTRDIEYDEEKNKMKKTKMKKPKMKKKKLKESHDNRMSAARHFGKAHALAKHGYNCPFDEGSEEHRMYHEGFKEGLDECYGKMMPIHGLVHGMHDDMDESRTVNDMASFGAHTPELDEGPVLDRVRSGQTGGVLDRVRSGQTGGVLDRVRSGQTGGVLDRVRSGQTGGVLDRVRSGQTGGVLDRVRSGMKEDEIEEMDKTAWLKHKAKVTPGPTFKAFGQTFKDKDVLKTDMSVFESWDRELNNLLTEYNEINEGLSVSVSDQEGQPKSVTVSATDHAADELISLVKKAGLGMFSHADHADADGEKDVEVIKAKTMSDPLAAHGDHDSMLSLIKKMSGHEQDHGSDYEDEEHDHQEPCMECGLEECSCGTKMMDESKDCNECGMTMEACECGPKALDEVETEEQMTYQVAEDQPQNPPDNGSANATNATKGNTAQNYAGAMYDKSQGDNPVAEDDMDEDMMGAEKCSVCHKSNCQCDDDESEKLDEWANQIGKGPGKGTDAQFTQDIDFMTKVISGGLNKPKRDQTTLPHTDVLPKLTDNSIATMLKKFHAIEK
jgi:hypothetical protein